MGGSYHPYERRGRISLDWTLIAVALMAGALIAGTVIRTDPVGRSSQFGTYVGGLRTLAPNETLVLFEDMSSGDTSAWSGGRRIDDQVGLGAAWLAEPPEAPLARGIDLPEDTVQAVLSFDLIGIDDWGSEALGVLLNGVSVLRQQLSTRPDIADGSRTEVLGADRTTVRVQIAEPRETAFASGEPALLERRVRVEILVTTPGERITLEIVPEPGDTPSDGPAPAWAVDNLIVVAERLP